jgi:hypothetical protein
MAPIDDSRKVLRISFRCDRTELSVANFVKQVDTQRHLLLMAAIFVRKFARIFLELKDV